MLIRLFLFSPVLLLTLVACGGAELLPTPTPAPFDSTGVYYLGFNGDVVFQPPSGAYLQLMGWNINQMTLFIRPGPVEILEGQ